MLVLKSQPKQLKEMQELIEEVENNLELAFYVGLVPKRK